MENDIALRIIAEARSWLGTPFHHQGRVKHVGCDCIGLVVGVAGALSLVSRTDGRWITACDVGCYPRRPQSSESHALQQALMTHLHEVPITDGAPGDVVLFRQDGVQPQHVGIMGDYIEGTHSLIHAYLPARQVVEHHLDALWVERMVGVYRFHTFCHPELVSGSPAAWSDALVERDAETSSA